MTSSERATDVSNRWRPFMWPFIGAAAIALADQGIKLAVLTARPQLTVIPNFFSISFATNTGAAFSLFRQFPGVLTVLGAGILVGLAVHVMRSAPTTTPLARTALALLIGGAAGNLIDRVRLGYVVDYLDVFAGHYHWPTFNLADSAITIGTGLLVLASFRDRPAPGTIPSGDAPGVRHR